MRHVLLFSLVFLCVPAIVSAQTENVLMGLYFDEARTIRCADKVPYQPFELWMWCKPGLMTDVRVLELRVLYPANCAVAGTTYNPNMNVIFGSLAGSADIAFIDCQTDWVWGFHQTIYPLSADPVMIQLMPYSATMHPNDRLESLAVLKCNLSQAPAERVSSACLNSCVTDYTPPVIDHMSFVTKTRLEVVFSEAVNPVSAQAASAYTVAQRLDGLGAIAVTTAALQEDGVTVFVDLAAPFLDNVPYVLREVGVKDLLGNAWVSYGEFGNGPNLVVSAVYAPDTLADCAAVLPCSLVVSNIGSFPAGGFRVGIELQYWDKNDLDENGTWRPNERVGAPYAYCAGLQPGGTFSYAIDFDIWQSYRYRNWAQQLRSSLRFVVTADIPTDWQGEFDSVEEANEKDNTAIAPVTILYPIPFGDTYVEASDFFNPGFLRSPFDDPAYPDPVTSYEVYRRSLEGTAMELATTIPANGSELYLCEIPRLPDREFVYLTVRAIRPGPGGTRSYTSCEALLGAPFAPMMPRGLTATGTVNGLLLSWLKNPEPDVMWYRVYRGTAPDFVPNYDSCLAEYPNYSYRTVFTWGDGAWHPGAGYYYKVSAVESPNRESEFAFVVGDEVIATMLQTFSAELRRGGIEVAWSLVKGAGAQEFAVMRKAGESGEYEALPGLVDRESDVSFSYRDESVEPGTSYRYCVAALEGGARSVLFETDAVAVPRRALALMQNHPNPFNPTTTIEYELPESGVVSLAVYDVAGRRIARLVNARQEQGSHAAQWMGRDQNGAAVASGMYFYKLEFGKESITRKMVFLK